MKCLVFPTLVLVTLFEGCPLDQSKQTPVPGRVSSYQRFVPTTGSPPVALNWALDTKTGQICRTWDWNVENAKPDNDGRVGIALAAPTCFDLYTRYPD